MGVGITLVNENVIVPGYACPAGDGRNDGCIVTHGYGPNGATGKQAADDTLVHERLAQGKIAPRHQLRNPGGGAELGYHKTVTVRYFDDESVVDAQYSYPVLQGIR